MVQTKMGRYWEQAKGWFFRKVWSFQTKEGRQTKVSKMRPTCQSHTDDATRKGRVLSDEKERLPIQDQNQLTLQHLQKEVKKQRLLNKTKDYEHGRSNPSYVL